MCCINGILSLLKIFLFILVTCCPLGNQFPINHYLWLSLSKAQYLVHAQVSTKRVTTSLIFNPTRLNFSKRVGYFFLAVSAFKFHCSLYKPFALAGQKFKFLKPWDLCSYGICPVIRNIFSLDIRRGRCDSTKISCWCVFIFFPSKNWSFHLNNSVINETVEALMAFYCSNIFKINQVHLICAKCTCGNVKFRGKEELRQLKQYSNFHFVKNLWKTANW